jgi:dihydroflavonol-4-reductase
LVKILDAMRLYGIAIWEQCTKGKLQNPAQKVMKLLRLSNPFPGRVFELPSMIAVTGASGLLGGNLVRELLAQGCRVRALIHTDDRAVRGLEVETVRADLEEPASLERAFDGVDVVYHLASLISISMDSWESVYRVNVLGTRNVVEACLKDGVRRLVHVSSTHARRPEPFDQPLDEDRPWVTDPGLPPYDRSKALGEIEIQKGLERGLDSVILIPSGILGPYDFRPSLAGEGLLLMQRGGLPALTTGGYNWVDAAMWQPARSGPRTVPQREAATSFRDTGIRSIRWRSWPHRSAGHIRRAWSSPYGLPKWACRSWKGWGP